MFSCIFDVAMNHWGVRLHLMARPGRHPALIGPSHYGPRVSDVAEPGPPSASLKISPSAAPVIIS